MVKLAEAACVRDILRLYLSLLPVVEALNRRGWRTKAWRTQKGTTRGGRPPIGNRSILAAILFVERTGITWADLPREMGCSYKTCLRRLKEWTAAGVWQRVN